MFRKVFSFGVVFAAAAVAFGSGLAPGQTPGQLGGSNGSYQASDPARDDVPAYITVRVPPGAELWFDGLKMAPTGHVRVFHSPPLTPRVRYVYEIRARWLENGRPITQTQSVAVYAGEPVDVDFPIAPGIEAQRFWMSLAGAKKSR
jgi:uncharacterized protein (TIGR03000 family)